MRLDYIDPIVQSAMAVLSEVTGRPVERGALSLRQSSTPGRGIAAVIGMTGDVEGRVILDMGGDTALSMAGIMNQESFTELNGLAMDTLMELANMVVARGVSALNDKGFAFRLTPPLIFTGSNLSCATSFDLETLIIPLRVSTGDMTLNVALRMKAL